MTTSRRMDRSVDRAEGSAGRDLRREDRVDLLHSLPHAVRAAPVARVGGLRQAVTSSGAISTSSRFLEPPSPTQPWMLQFGGHHLALNITIAGSRGVLTPTLTGAQPALFKLSGKAIRPVGRESDKALALLQALDETQRKQAVLSYQVADLVLGPGQDGKKIAPEGLKASNMNASGRPCCWM